MQIIGYETAAGDGPATLVIGTDGTVKEHPLHTGAELSFTLDHRHCAGDRSDGHHEPCSRDDAPYCEVHTSHWPCAVCTGTCAMPVAACHEEHAVYLAAFAPETVKVGVTRSWRLQRRLREQGADRAAHIRTVKDGRIARQLEADLADRFPDRVRVPTKIESLHRTVDGDRWNAIVDEFDPIETFDFDYGFSLDTRPVAETVASGSIVGTQGRVLVLERGGTAYAVDLRDLVGYDVTTGTSTRSLQSSFGSFE
ncbi:putative GIY-YIG superfamily nuclease with N-terminal metal-binding region, DUF2797 family [Halanaeroarchaeum sp. HSR-CO]|uniref:DUF2797 domain-containing protein n=1 Tax=Halanaeroarchaeum sp. HSR-CO TaxID=2866382 RepID=UPI00217E5ED9|nr:DUF2797 domain-containing protein [Halanaeroarchaeum sp. HSR-CO]UWG47587.1 putative GIY-YIG superfamily nuclease with N-terminal metal-binding region, DUF2797 family [Halanaeroarchaeum sp. HSR-CO]